MSASEPLRILVASPSTVCATALLNRNSVPDNAGAALVAASSRFALLCEHVRLVQGDVDRARDDFVLHLRRMWPDYVAAAKQQADRALVIHADGLPYLSRMHSVMYEFKAFLDLLALLLARLIDSQGAPEGFKKGLVQGQMLSGGKLINWLSTVSEADLPTKEALRSLLLAASLEWVTAAVEIRDALGHRRNIPGFAHMRIRLSPASSRLRAELVLQPEMPGGWTLPAYAQSLRDRAGLLCSETLRLAPRVDSNINEPWAVARSRLST